MHNSESSNGFANVSGAREGDQKISPDAIVTSSGANEYYRKQEREDARKQEEATKREAAEQEAKKRKILRRIIGAAAMMATSAGLIFGQIDREQGAPMKQTEWENMMKNTFGESNTTVFYSEDGSRVVYDGYANANGEKIQVNYDLGDIDNDGKIEKAYSSSKVGGAEYDAGESDGVTPLAAVEILNEQMGVKR